MNRKLGIALSSITATTLCLQPAMVMAKMTTQPIVENQEMKVILTAQDFYETFLSYKQVNENNETKYVLFSEVTEQNADVLVAAKQFYNSLTPEFGEYYLIESDGVVVQSNYLKQDIDALIKSLEEKNEFFNFNEFCNIAQGIVDARVVEEEKEEVKEEPKEEIKEDKKEESKEDKKEETLEEKKEEVKEDVVEVEEEEVKPEIKQPFAPIDKEESLLENLITEQPVVEEVEEVEEIIETEQEFTKGVKFVQNPIETMNVPVQEVNSTTSTAQNFINKYLTSSQGNIFNQANQFNYETIIGGLSAWNKLSSSEKNAVNTILTNKVGKTYQTLLKEAQAIRYGGSAPVTNQQTTNAPFYSVKGRVNTATQTNAGLYAILCGVMAALIGFFAKKRNEVK